MTHDKFPRTAREAFGPRADYSTWSHEDDQDSAIGDAAVYWLAVCCSLALIVALVLDWLP